MTDSWSVPEKILALNKEPFGPKLIDRLANALIEASKLPNHPYDGACLVDCHRDYCGHGLKYHNASFLLANVNDGYLDLNSPIHSWNSVQAFVDFFSLESDYSCAGADSKSTIFYTEDLWSLNNQRLTAKTMEDFISSKGHDNLRL